MFRRGYTCFLSILFFFFLNGFAVAATVYVATGGSDYNDGTLEKPFATINKGSSVLLPGDTLYIMGGTYHQTAYVTNSGTASAPIVIAGFPGQEAIVDGADTLPTGDLGGALFQVVGNYVVVRDITVKNSNWEGLALSGHHNQGTNIKSHRNKEHGIVVSGDYGLVQNCEVWWNSKSNENGKLERGNWASGLSAARHPRYVTLRNNRVWNNWGEGLSTFEADHTTMEDNVVYDNWLNVYISDATYVLFQRNLIYSTPGNPCTRPYQIGIAMGDEKYNPPSSNNTVINNLVLGNSINFFSWLGVSGSGLVNALIAHNTFVNSVSEANFKIDGGTHSNTRIENNIIEQSDSLSIAHIENSLGLSFSHNLWSKIPPSSASGTGDVIGDPALAKTGGTDPGTLTPEWFKILPSSPARDRAKIVSEVPEDFFRKIRGANPDIGAHEYDKPPNPPTGLRIIY